MVPRVTQPSVCLARCGEESTTEANHDRSIRPEESGGRTRRDQSTEMISMGRRNRIRSTVVLTLCLRMYGVMVYVGICVCMHMTRIKDQKNKKRLADGSFSHLPSQPASLSPRPSYPDRPGRLRSTAGPGGSHRPQSTVKSQANISSTSPLSCPVLPCPAHAGAASVLAYCGTAIPLGCLAVSKLFCSYFCSSSPCATLRKGRGM